MGVDCWRTEWCNRVLSWRRGTVLVTWAEIWYAIQHSGMPLPIGQERGKHLMREHGLVLRRWGVKPMYLPPECVPLLRELLRGWVPHREKGVRVGVARLSVYHVERIVECAQLSDVLREVNGCAVLVHKGGGGEFQDILYGVDLEWCLLLLDRPVDSRAYARQLIEGGG